jgi:hypothetical protein
VSIPIAGSDDINNRNQKSPRNREPPILSESGEEVQKYSGSARYCSEPAIKRRINKAGTLSTSHVTVAHFGSVMDKLKYAPNPNSIKGRARPSGEVRNLKCNLEGLAPSQIRRNTTNPMNEEYRPHRNQRGPF